MAQFLTTNGRHLECAIQTKPVVELELALIEKRQSLRFRHNSIICHAERYERVRLVWHSAKVKGHTELKIENPRVKTLSRRGSRGGGS